MTTSSTVSAPSSRHLNEPSQQRLDLQRRRSLAKITGRKLRTPRKFVVTDVSDEELDVLKPSASLSAMSDADDNDNNNNNSEDLSASSASTRKGKTQVKGRFTITDLSPESPEALPDLSSSMGPTPSRALEAQRRPSRKMASRKPFQSAGDVRPSVGLTKSRLSQRQQQQHDPCLFASFQCLAPSSPSSHSMRTSSSSACPSSNQVSHGNNQTQTVFDNHFEFLEKETFEMKSTLERMVATNAQWIEALTSVGLMQDRPSPAFVPKPVEPTSEEKYRMVEKAYLELQANYDAVCQKSERVEVKNAMLEICLQQQINRSTMLRSQLDKLTKYTEKLIGASSEPTLRDYSSDLNSIFGEQSEAHSPTADEMTSGGEYSFDYEVLKSRRHRRRDMDEECMSDTSTEGESLRKTLLPLPYERSNDNNRYLSDVELTTTDLSSTNDRDSPTALDSLLDDQVNQLRQSLHSISKGDADERVSVIGSLDSMAVCPSVSNFGLGGDDEYNGNNQLNHSAPLPNGGPLERSSSVVSHNYSTVSSTSSLAGYGLHLANMAQSKAGYYSIVAATSLFGPHPEPYPNALNQQTSHKEDDTVYNVLSPENLRFHDCQSLLQVAKEPSTRRGFPFTTSTKSVSLPGANEVSGRTQTNGSLFQRLSVRRR